MLYIILNSITLNPTQFHNRYITGRIYLTYLVDGKYGNWSVWTVCTKSCGGGLQSRTRDCKNPPPSTTGKDCQGPSIETRRCSNSFCKGLIKFTLCMCSYNIIL